MSYEKDSMTLEFRKALYELRRQGALNDVTINVANGEKFQAHRIILASSSGYFRALFTTKLEKQFDCYIPEVPAEVMSQLLEYIYRRSLQLNDDNVLQILLVADYLDIDNACYICSRYLVSALTPTNCIALFKLGRLYNLTFLMEKSWNYLMMYFNEVLESKKELLELDLEDITAILACDSLNVKSEEIVWEAAQAWLEESQRRKPFVVELLRCVRLGLLSPEFFLDNIRNHHLIIDNEECRPIIIDTLRFLFDLDVVVEEMSFYYLPVDMTCPRLPHEILFVIGGWSGGNPTDCIETYDIRADRWSMIDDTDPKGPRAYHIAVAVGNEIYVIGGYNGHDYFNSCRCFNVIDYTWRDISPMNKNRCYVSVALLDNFIYAMGGYNGQRRLHSAERYDIKNNQWSLIASMNNARSDATACSLNGKIYIVGGFNGHECMNSVEVYDPTLDQWTPIPSMVNRRSGVSCVVLHDQIYVMGGFNGLSRMSTGERYNPKTRMWHEVTRMINARSNFALAAIDNSLIAVGGFNGVSTTTDVERYFPESDEWISVCSLHVNRSALSACVMSGLPNVTHYSYEGRSTLLIDRRLEQLKLDSEEVDNVQSEQQGMQRINRTHLSLVRPVRN